MPLVAIFPGRVREEIVPYLIKMQAYREFLASQFVRWPQVVVAPENTESGLILPTAAFGRNQNQYYNGWQSSTTDELKH